MMKRTASVVFIMLLVFLSGCSSVGGYTEPEEVATVSAIGIDLTGSGVNISMQIALGGEKKTQVINGEGERVEFALSHLSGVGHKRRELSHCAIIAIGDGVEEEMLEEVFQLCRENDDLPDSVLMIATHNALELLSLEDALGYDLAATMKPSEDRHGLFSKNRFYELDSEQNGGAIALPFFSVNDGEYDIHGLKLYMDMKEKVLLDRGESGMFLIARGIFTSGQIDYESKGRILSVGIAKAIVKQRKEGGEITVSCLLIPEQPLSSENAEEIESSLKKGAEKMADELYSKYGDVFGMGNFRYIFEFEVKV